MNELIAYLIDNMMVDFQGDLDLSQASAFLRKDGSPAAKALLQRLQQDRQTSDLLITLADCLKDHLRSGINEQVVQEQIKTYVES